MIQISKYNKQHPLRVFEAFAGYGSQSLAFKYLKEKHPEFDFEVVGFSEIEPSAIQAYRLLHGREIPNYGNIALLDWNEVPDFDFISWSSPCQDFSNAGLRKGAEEGSGTRSSLIFQERTNMNIFGYIKVGKRVSKAHRLLFEGKTLIMWYKDKPIIGTMIDGKWCCMDINGNKEILMYQSLVTQVSFLPSPNEDRERKNPSHHR